ncbi:MAG TPA: hypothetical protein PLY57_11930 [Deltaproteobacteria bacterium]|nr:hypothetical protein [Deltaproteobacteria bacterium]
MDRNLLISNLSILYSHPDVRECVVAMMKQCICQHGTVRNINKIDEEARAMSVREAGKCPDNRTGCPETSIVEKGRVCLRAWCMLWLGAWNNAENHRTGLK